MQRIALGIIAILLLVIGGVLMASQGDSGQQIGGPCLRVGILMALVWLAEPQLRLLPRWLPIAVVLLAILLAVRPKLFPIALIIVAALWLLRPRIRRTEH